MAKFQPSDYSGYGLAMFGAVLFATKGIFIKFAYAEGIDADTLLAMRMAFALPIFSGTALYLWVKRPAAERPSRRMLVGGALTGVLGYYISSWLDFMGLVYISAQLERLILFTYPFFTIVFTALMFRKPIDRSASAGAIVSYSGLVLVMTGSSASAHGDILTGGAFVLTAAASFALYQVLAREFIIRMGSDFYTGFAMSAATIAVFLHFFATGHDLGDFVLTPAGYGIVAGLAFFATLAPAFAMAAGLGRIGAQSTSIISTLSPVATVILAVSILGEPFGVVDAMGTLLVVSGVGVYTLIDNRRRASEQRTFQPLIASEALEAAPQPIPGYPDKQGRPPGQPAS